MDAEELKREVEAGRIGIDRLIDLIAMQQRKISELERKLGGAKTTAKFAEAFSLRAEEKRQEARGKKKRKRQRL